MHVKLFTFRCSGSLGGFDDRPLAHFIRDKEVLSFREHFFCVNDVPHLLCILTWQDAVVSDEDLAVAQDLRRAPAPDSSRQPIHPPAAANTPRRRRSEPDPTAGLDERLRTLFNTLRDWRAATGCLPERVDGLRPCVHRLVPASAHIGGTLAEPPLAS